MSHIDVDNPPFILKKVVIEGEQLVGPAGPAGPAGPTPSTFDSNNITVDNAGYNSLQELLDDLTYVVMAINTFTNTVVQLEKTITPVTDVGFSWTLNKVPTSQQLSGTSIGTPISITPGTLGYTLTGLSLLTNGTWTLTVDDGTTQVQKTTTLTFLNKIYWGVATIPATINSSFVLSLGNSSLQATRTKSFTVNAGSGQYIWAAVPVAYGTPIFKVGGFEGGFEAPDTITLTNASGHAEDYYVVRSSESGLGSTTVNMT